MHPQRLPALPRFRVRAMLVLTAVLVVSGCDRARDMVGRVFDDRTPRERYVARLEAAGVATSAAARDWIDGFARALRTAPLVTSPHDEQGYLAPSAPATLAYRIHVRRGQELAFALELLGDSTSLVFVELWDAVPDTLTPMRRLAVTDSGERLLTYRPRRDGDVIVAAQPELLRGGRFTVSVRVGPTLAFPIPSGRESDIGSRFGDARDGGRRSHHGVDIFARRGTPVIAVADGSVSRVSTTEIGGKVVWLRDLFGHSVYYAHLDSQHVAAGMLVRRGDTVGFVGNTGNARTTPPHLHFGVYRRGDGPVDPHWYVHRPRGAVPRLTADTSVLGRWARVPVDRVELRAGPDARAASLRPLGRHTAVSVVAAVGDWYRVALPDGVTGYVPARAVESAAASVRTTSVLARSPLLARPQTAMRAEDVVLEAGAGDVFHVHAEFDDFLLVRPARGREAWLARASQAERPGLP